jgi:hypothetical protein
MAPRRLAATAAARLAAMAADRLVVVIPAAVLARHRAPESAEEDSLRPGRKVRSETAATPRGR